MTKTLLKGNQKSKAPIRALTIFCTLFYLAWTAVELFITPTLDKIIDSEVINTIIVDVLIKNLLWTLPAILLLNKYNDSAYIHLCCLFTLKKSNAKWLLSVPIVTIFVIISALIQNGKLQISPDFGISSIIVCLFVGLTEESVFRGLLLNLTYNENNKALPLIANSVMFLLIHFPIWIRTGVFISIFTSFGFASIIVLSLIFSFLFIKSKSLVVPILVHSIYDLWVMMLI